jgi:uncharacterized protein (TIGR01777 family)
VEANGIAPAHDRRGGDVKVVVAGGSGSLGRRVAADLRRRSVDVVILTRTPRPEIDVRQVVWDGSSVGDWASELSGAVLLNLAGELVDRRPTPANIEVLRRSRVDPTRALVEASTRLATPPVLWLQMSTLAIYGDAGEDVVDELHPPAAGPPQMAGVARAWEQATDGAKSERLVVLRTGLVLDGGTPALDRLTTLTRFGLGGRIGTGEQWVSWLHIVDFLRAVQFLMERSTLDGVVHVTSPNPIRNRDMMATLRSQLRRPWSPPTAKPLVHLGAWFMRTDPALALTGRRGVPSRLLAAGFEFEHPDFDEAIADLLTRPE